MRSVTSYFNGSVARSDLRRYWPILFGYTAIWIIALPLMLWTMGSYYYESIDSVYPLSEHIVELYPMTAVMAFLFGGVLAMALFSYLMTGRSVGLMHSIPVRRDTLFITHTVTGMGMLTAGNLLVVLLTVLVQVLRYGVVSWTALGLWLVFQTVACLLFFLLGVLCCMVTGWLLAVPVVYGVINFFAAGLTILLQALATFFYYGYNGIGDFPGIVHWLTPVAKMSDLLEDCSAQHETLADGSIQWWLEIPAGTTQGMIGYFVAALMLGALAWLLYRHRRSEAAGDPLAYSWMRPVFRWGVGLLGGLSAGIILFLLLFNRSSYLDTLESVWLVICMLPTTVVCYCGAEMLASKSLAALRRCWKGALLLYLAVLLVCGAMYMDLFGHERRVPEVGEVKSVALSISGTGSTRAVCDEPATIQKIVDLHRQLLAGDREPSGEESRTWLSLEYHLADDSTLYRSYTIWNPQEVSEEMDALLQEEEVRIGELFGKAVVTRGMNLWGGYVSPAYYKEEPFQLTGDQAEKILDALFADLDAGCNLWEATYNERLYMGMILQKGEKEEIYVDFIGPDWSNTIRALVGAGLADSEEELLRLSQDVAHEEWEKGLTS